MSAETSAVGTTVKDMLFKEYSEGISKKNGNPYRMVVLHDPVSLDNVSFFIEEHSSISVAGFKLKDKVKAAFSMEFKYGRLQPVLQSIKPSV